MLHSFVSNCRDSAPRPNKNNSDIKTKMEEEHDDTCSNIKTEVEEERDGAYSNIKTQIEEHDDTCWV